MLLEPYCFAGGTLLFVVRLLAGRNCLAYAVGGGIAKASVPVLHDLPAVQSHSPMLTLIATEVGMQRVAIGLYALYHTRIGWYSAVGWHLGITYCQQST